MPGYKRFFSMLDGGKMRNCHLTSDDTKRCLFIYGPELIKLKGCMTRQRPNKIKEMPLIPIPTTVYDHHNSDVLSMDFLYVQGIPFHDSISTDYKYRTTDAVRGKKGKGRKARKPNARNVRNFSKKAIN